MTVSRTKRSFVSPFPHGVEVRPVVGNIQAASRGPFESPQVLLRGRLRPSELPVRYTDGPPCYGPCESDGKLYLMVFDDEQVAFSSL